MDILHPREIDFFYREGYLVVKNVIPKVNVYKAREIIELAFATGVWRNSRYDSSGIINNIYNHYPELISLLYTDKYFAVLSELLGGDYVFLPECAVHRNRFTNWHKDTTSQEAAGHTFHKPTENVMVQVAIYFQENGRHGGGLTLIPGSQHSKDSFVQMYYGNRYHRAKNKLAKLFHVSVFHRKNRHPKCTDVMAEPGDLVLFDLRVDHRSTLPKTLRKKAPDKFAIFNTAGHKSSPVKKYQDYLRTRPEPYYQLMRKSEVPVGLRQRADTNGVEVYH